MISIIGIRSSFRGLHYWKDAPSGIKFLGSAHRHTFYVEVEFQMNSRASLDRQLEFFTVQRFLDRYLEHYKRKSFSFSCEQLAAKIWLYFFDIFEQEHAIESCKVLVSEDNENYGGIDAVWLGLEKKGIEALLCE